jgi:hypothetical protein
MYWTDGSFYKGEWIEGIQHGKGKITFADGLEKEGQFMNNMYVDSKNYQYTIDQDDPDRLMNKSVYSHMPRNSFTAINNQNKSYTDNNDTQKRRYSKDKRLLNSQDTLKKQNPYHSPEKMSSKFNNKLHDVRQNQLSYTTPYNMRNFSHTNSQKYDRNNRAALPDINERYHSMNIEEKCEYDEHDLNGRQPNHDDDDYDRDQSNGKFSNYDSDYMGPRKPYMREDRSTSPPNHDPIFRRANYKSIGVQETHITPLIHKKIEKKRSRSKPKKNPQQKYKFSQDFFKKYPKLFKGVQAQPARKEKKGGMMTVVYRPWIPASTKYSYFDDIAHKYKVY